MKQSRTQVVIAGAGPVGSVAAYYLAMQGIEVVLTEAAPDCATNLRASTFHPPTLELLDELGIAKELIERGLKAPVYKFRERSTGETISFDLGEIADVTRFPYRLQCEQYHLSHMLTQAITNVAGADVRFGTRVIGFEQDENGVGVFVETPLAVERIQADYLIGADGANSMVRKWLDTDFTGFTYPEKFLCFTTETPLEEHLEGLAYVNYVSDPHEWLVLLRVPSLWRVLVPANEDSDDALLLGDENKNAVFDRLMSNGADVETAHRTIYRVHQRVANRFRYGRVLIIGDAAHLNNPIGGYGMNSGIHDAMNLCEKMVNIYRGRAAPEPLLDTFERQRQRTCREFIQKQTMRNLQYLSEGNENAHKLRKMELERIQNDPVARRDYLLRQSMIHSLAEEKELA